MADLALQLDGHLLDEHIAYICAPKAVDTPFARAYRILEVMPYSVKSLKTWVKENGIGVLDIKKRGTSVTPEELRKQLLPGGKAAGKKSGKKTATLVLTRIGEERVAVSVEPV
ncbi:THUMP domain-like protein [compost metagenome]